MRQATALALLSVVAFALVASAVACTQQPKELARTQNRVAAPPADVQTDLSRREASLIDRLAEDSADPASRVVRVPTPAAAASKAGFAVLVPADARGRSLTAVYVEGLEGSMTSQGRTQSVNVYMAYGDDVLVSQYPRTDVGSAKEALFGVLNNPPTNEIARETKVRGSFALKWDMGGRPATMESTRGAGDSQYGYSVPFSEVIWWEDGVSRWVGSYVLSADELVGIANSMK